MIAIHVKQIGGGRYQARLDDGSELVKSSRQPFLDGARELLRRGIDPVTPIVMRRPGSATDALRSTIGAAAKLTVDEGTQRFRSWQPFAWGGPPRTP